jgi:multidrug resistance efflux pump
MLAAGQRRGYEQAQREMAQAEAYRQQGAQEAMAQQAQAQPAPAAAPAQDDVIAQIERLAALHTAGALSDEEFAAAKKKLLA